MQRTPHLAGPVTVSGLEDHLGYWLRLVSNHVSQSFRERLEPHDVTVAEWVLLRALYGDEGIMPSQLAQKVGLTRGAVSKLMDRLAAKGLVAVGDDPADGRALRVALTDRGRSLVPTLATEADRNDAEAFGHLGEEERTALRHTVEGLVARLGLKGAPVD